jgi:hypothetical protein
MDNRLFVSKYAVELPTKAELVEFLKTHSRRLPENPPPTQTSPRPTPNASQPSRPSLPKAPRSKTRPRPTQLKT